MKKLIEVSLKSIIFFIGWAICASVIPIPDIDNAALWRFFAELIPFLAIVVMSVIFWFVDRKKTKLHLTQRPVYSSVLGGTVGLSWLGISVGILLFTGSARIEGTNHISMLWLWILSAFINTIMQEMLVRGYLYQMIKRNYNVVAATVVSTILFTFAHGGAFEAGTLPVLNVLTMSLFMTAVLSIPNQKLILREKAMSLPEWDNSEILEFIDNGHTGTNFERPAVQELLTMVQAGKINCIIVKDLSRFGRNSIETGYFIERVFPLYHTRFISVSDDFDTANFKGDTGGIDIAFKYLISECYSRDMSMKTKSAKYAKMRRGEYQSVICPYGYRKSADGRMEPDEDVAPNVQMIFQWASEGNTAAEITRKLYAMNIPTPGEYRKLKGKDYYNVSRTNGVWSTSTVLRILEDQRYIGTYVIGKRKVKEIGSRHTQLKDESEWFKIPNHHPAIVSVDLFEKANASIKRFSLSNKKPRDYLLRGKVFCGCCDHATPLWTGSWAT